VTGGGSEHHDARFRCPRQFGCRECVHGQQLPIARNYNRTSQFLYCGLTRAKQHSRRATICPNCSIGRVTSSATRSDVFCPKLPFKRKCRIPFGRQWAASMPSAGAALPDIFWSVFQHPEKFTIMHARACMGYQRLIQGGFYDPDELALACGTRRSDDTCQNSALLRGSASPCLRV